MTPPLCKAARLTLGLSQKDLAAAAGLGLSTIALYERAQRYCKPSNRQAIFRAFEERGIIFTRDGLVGSFFLQERA